MSFIPNESKEKKLYVIEKLLYLDKNMRKRYEDSFNNPNDYFNLDGIILNKFIQGPKLNPQNKLISYSYVGSPEIFDKKTTLRILERESKLNINFSVSSKDSERSQDHKYRIKNINTLSFNDDNKLTDMFQIINKRVNTNNVNDFYGELPDDILVSMKSQERLLKNYEKHQEELGKISSKINSRVKSKTKRRLLVESPKSYVPSFTEPFHQKNEVNTRQNTLQVNGKNLLKSEFERVRLKKGKKVVYFEENSNELHDENICLRYNSSKGKNAVNYSHIRSLDNEISI